MNNKRCNHFHPDCAHAVGMYCKLLNDHINKAECPFYKTKEQMQQGQMEAHQHLVSIGSLDLVEKYEYNKLRTW